MRGSIRKQSRKILSKRRHLLRYRALRSMKGRRGGAATKAPAGLLTGQSGLRCAQMPPILDGRQGCSPLPCICRLFAILRFFAVPSEPLFSYVTRALPGPFALPHGCRPGAAGRQPRDTAGWPPFLSVSRAFLHVMQFCFTPCRRPQACRALCKVAVLFSKCSRFLPRVLPRRRAGRTAARLSH